ncbi:unnamed protein product [Polarella glacialis]|uniref:ABC1 atypical kinase-like domain-containing protein n=1 Tax=Polarella glacialis TaxID=89957 RepID=A0A813K759_POLGL|nr:unnamed protein product [Polarella glacialis]
MLRVFWAAGMVYVKVKLLRWRLWSASLEGKDAVAEWNSLHEVLGCFFYLQTVELRGFWIKLGQQLSVNIMLPPQYVKELSKLQDKIPSMPLSTVLAIVKAEFGEAAARIIIDPDLPPLGTASIAQVHKATWQPVPGGPTRGIVVKVQHQGVDSMFRQDLRAAAILARILAWFDPEGVPDLRPLIKTLRKVALDELDFRLEATAQMRAADAVKESGADVMVPRVVPALVRRRALGMDYVDGEQLVTAGKRLPQADLDRLIAALVDHFGVQFAVDGHFHADPHPGNLLVERSTGQLVVLDWGMCVTLPDGAAQAYAQLFVACATSNIWLLIQALESIGVSFKEGDSFEPLVILHALRFVLRDSKPVGIAVGELKSMIHAGDDLGKTGPDRYKKSPMDIISGEMLYFGKSLELLFMVSSQLGVTHPILQTLFRRSYVKLLRGSCAPCAPGSALCRNPHDLLPSLPDVPAARGAVEQELLGLLREHYKQGHILGAQLCVLELPSSSATSRGRHHQASPQLLADLAVGVKSWLEPEPVTTATTFNLLDLSKLPLALALLKLVDAGRLRLSDALPGLLPGQPSVTVQHVLSHTAGLWKPLPPGVANLKQLLDFETMLAAVLASPVAEPPGYAQRYHHTSFGYLCAAACRSLAGSRLSKTR